MKLSAFIAAAAAAAALLGTGPVFAQANDHAAHHAPAASAAPATTTDGEVRQVDKAQGKITLKHGPLANLDMPGMTMVFKVADPTMLDRVRPGDKVRFAADNVKGALTVTALETVK